MLRLVIHLLFVLEAVLLPRGSPGRLHLHHPVARGRVAALAAVFGLTLVLVVGARLSPATAAALGAPKAYVGIFNDNAVAVIDTESNRVLTTIPIPTGPHGLVISPDGLRVYASSDGASTVSVISTVTDRVVSSIEVGRAPHGLAISRDGRQVLVAVFGESQVAVIDTARNEVIARIPVGNPHNIAISPDGRTAYVASQQPGAPALAIVDLATKQQTGTVSLGKTPRALNFSPDGAALYFTLAGSDALQVLDPQRNQVVGQIPVGASPHHPLFTTNGKYGLVVSQGVGQLTVIDPASRQVVGTVLVGKFPHWIAASPDGSIAYVTNEGANSVSVVDIAQERVVATIPVGNAPRKIVVQPGSTVKTGVATTPPMHPTMLTQAPRVTPAITAGAEMMHVRIENFAFVPAQINVPVSTTVVWSNADPLPHTSTSKDGAWDSKPIQPGANFQVTFDKPGTYVYGCSIHPFMQAMVIVGN